MVERRDEINMTRAERMALVNAGVPFPHPRRIPMPRIVDRAPGLDPRKKSQVAVLLADGTAEIWDVGPLERETISASSPDGVRINRITGPDALGEADHAFKQEQKLSQRDI